MTNTKHEAVRLVLACTIAGLPLTAAAQSVPEATDAVSSFGARAKTRARPNVGAVQLKAEDAKHSAGALGEPVRALTDIPGVARAGFDSGALSVWGSTDAETHTYIDGVELPLLFHPGGFRSALQPALLDTLTLTKGAPGAEYGRGLGGVVEITTQRLDNPEPHAALDVNTFDVAGSLRGGTGPVRGAWGGRLGYVDRLAHEFAARAGNIVPLPEYADGFAKFQLDLPERQTVSAVWLGTHDAWQRGTTAVDPGSSRIQTQQRALQLGYVQYQRAYADRARVLVTPFISSYSDNLRSQSGQVPWEQDTRELRYGVRASYTLPMPALDVQVGIDAMATESELTRAGTLSLPPREGDITVFAQPPGRELTRDRYATHDVNVAPYASLNARWRGLTVTPGVRLEVHALSSDRILPKLPDVPGIGGSQLLVRPEPLLSLRYFAGEWLALGARAALTHQAAAPADRSAVFGNPALGLSKAMTIAGGPQLSPVRELTIGVTGFYKVLGDLTVRNPAVPLPRTAALVAGGSGRSFGGEVALQWQIAQVFSGQLSYTLSRSERQDSQNNERLFDLDQTQLLSLSWSYRLAGFRFGGRARVATGSPRTAVVGHYRNLLDDRFEPLFGAHNDLRLPTFFALDLRIEYDFSLGAVTGSLSVDVLNVTNQRNVEAVAYRYDYAAREDVLGLPILALLGLSVEL
ncbi:MAG: hypothetical protein RL701_4496 [Pseudomonadota bacterium]